MSEPAKDTIYIDVDDEITGIIDKLQSSDGKVVALVLPKRATVLQSIVNMKLLKRTADDSKKHLVLITTEAGLLPLAGAVGVHVAKTLTSRPEVPAAPSMPSPSEEMVDEDEVLPLDGDEPLSSAKAANPPVGALAGAADFPLKPDDAVETLELDNEEPAAAAAATAKAPKPKKNKKLAVPSFNRFRLMLILGVLLIIIIVVGAILAFSVLPKATINIKTDASNVNTSVNLTLDTTASTLNASQKIVPAKQVTEQKTYTGTASSTGQQNNGQKATGNVTMTAGSCTANVPSDIPSGTALTANSQTYVTTEGVSFVPTVFHGHCTYQGQDSNGSNNIAITAQSAGTGGNVSGANFNVYNRSDVSASGSTSGGTDDIVQVVSQTDIDTATSKINTNDSTVKSDLQNQLEGQNLYPVTATFSDGTPSTTASAKVGDATGSVTVTEVVTYTMLGASQNDLKTLIDNDIKSQIDTSQQGILSEGLSQNSFKLNNVTANGAALTLATTAEVGPNIDVNSIKQQAAGKKPGDVESAIKNNPDITDVSVKLSPFWVSTTPKNTSKISVIIAKPTTTATKNND